MISTPLSSLDDALARIRSGWSLDCRIIREEPVWFLWFRNGACTRMPNEWIAKRMYLELANAS